MNLNAFGNTALGVVARQKGVFSTKDNYTRRENLVRNWALDTYGEDYTTGAYHASHNMRPTRKSDAYQRGYKRAKNLIT